MSIQYVTHDGAFHADDVLAFVVLTRVMGTGTLLRTRNPDMTRPADARVVFDVGGLHDEAAMAFDHHQPGRPTRPDGVPYSAFGLVWKAFGQAYVASVADGESGTDGDVVEGAFADLDEGFVRGVDLVDNGIAGEAPGPLHLASLVDAFVPADGGAEASDAAFAEASSFAGAALAKVAKAAVRERVAALSVREAALGRPEASVLVLPEALPWGRTLAEEAFASVLFVVSPRTSDATWTCRAVPATPGSFEVRFPFPVAWAGLRDRELAAASGVDDAVFCHAGRFLCVARSREGCLALARAALA